MSVSRREFIVREVTAKKDGTYKGIGHGGVSPGDMGHYFVRSFVATEFCTATISSSEH